jgi:hypothetical protein
MVTNSFTAYVDDSLTAFRFDDPSIRLGKTITEAGPGTLELLGDFRVEIPGSATLASTTNFTLVDVASGTLSDAVGTWLADSLWDFDSTASGIDAYAVNIKGTLAYDDPPVVFAPEDAGLVRIDGTPPGSSIALSVGVTNFTTTIGDVVTELENNTNFSSVQVDGAYGVRFRVTPSAATSYFIWDNVGNSLGADVFSVEAALPPQGTVLFVR